MSDPELDDLRRKRLQELERQASQEAAQGAVDQARREEAEAQKQAILRSALEPAARERLTRVRMARPEVASNLENQIVQLAVSGRLKSPITDEQLKSILEQSTRNRREINIERR